MKTHPTSAILGCALALVCLGPVPAARSADSTAVEVPIISMDAVVQKDLLNLDRLLETNPKLEEDLRNNVDRLTESTFRAQNPDIDALLRKQPGLPRALAAERHFFVHRQVARLAKTKVLRKDAIALDDFLTANPDIAKALQKRPNQIVNSDFLIAHPKLGRFFEAHPSLSSVLLKRADKKADGKSGGGKK